MSDLEMQSMSSAVSKTMLLITQTKISQVTNRLKTFEAQKRRIFDDVEAEASSRKRVKLLLDGLISARNRFKKAETHTDVDGEVATMNCFRLLEQSRSDSSISPSLLKELEHRLRLQLNIQSVKYEYAYLFGRLVNEWLSNPTLEIPNPLLIDEGKTDECKASEPSEKISRKDMYEQRAKWEEHAYSPKQVDVTAIEQYLTELFAATKDSKQALEDLRFNVQTTESWVIHSDVSGDIRVLKWCIKTLLTDEFLSNEKKEILKDFSINHTLLEDVADVLNLRLASFDTWNWDPKGVPIEMKRKLNGKYRDFMDEDLLDSLLLQYIGVKWKNGLKRSLKEVVSSSAWKKLSNRPMTTIDLKRREYFLGAEHKKKTLQDERLEKYRQDFFMNMLPGTLDVTAPMGNTFVESRNYLKHSLLHLLSTESLLNTRLYGQCTVLRSDFKCLERSLPHSTIFAVLKFFGVSEQWMAFFQRFLETPVTFTQDKASFQPKQRKRGIPMDHSLSDIFVEVLLFCMDFAVNQGTDGGLLYRLQDDFWFWGQEQTCINAWKEITRFAEVMGISINEEKTGCVQITEKLSKGSEPSHPVGLLPKGGIHWGFLKLDPISGRFVVDQSLVDKHTAELKLRLAACKSIFAWVQAWNSYLARVFYCNFCQPVNCFGREYVDMLIETFQSIQRTLFSVGDDRNTASGSWTEHLRDTLSERFGVTDIPDGFFYFPVELGGLGLHNPFIDLFSDCDYVCKTPISVLERAFEAEGRAYRRAKEAFLNRSIAKQRRFQVDYVPENPDEFMALEEFTRYVEETSSNLSTAYRSLLSVPRETRPHNSPGLKSAIARLGDAGGAALGKFGIHQNWNEMDSYHQWVVEMYGTEINEKFGGLQIVDAGLLPIGIMQTLHDFFNS